MPEHVDPAENHTEPGHEELDELGSDAASAAEGYEPLLRQRVTELEFRASLLDAVSDSVLVHGIDGRLMFANRAACDTMGYTLEEMLDLRPFGWVSEQFRRNPAITPEALLQAGSLMFESSVRHKNGSPIPVEVHARVIHHEEHLVVVSVVRDLTERLRTEEYIHHLAYYDALTNLANRTLFCDRLEMAMVRAARHGYSTALMFLDLDHFKLVNDTFGHPLGDELLKVVGQRLLTLVREGDTVARFGGDEFTLLLEEVAEDEAEEIARRTLSAFDTPFVVAGHDLSVTTSIGIAISYGGTFDSESLMRQADTAMYQAKSAGRSAYRIYEPSMEPSATRFVLLGELRHALEQGEFSLQFQPQVDIQSGEIVGAEALLRWQHPTRGNIVPVDFIPLAEESGLIIPIGEWVLREACRQCRDWSDGGIAPIRVGVNVSARQLHGRDLVRLVATALEETGLPGERLELEVTESAAMKDTAHVFQQFEALRQLGVKVAIDDFGTGHSSLDRLKRFPVDTLKVDGSFMTDLSDDPSGRAIASSIIVLGRSLGLSVVAEGVERMEQLHFLRQKGCHLAQGYLYCEPLTAGEFAKLLQTEYAEKWRGFVSGTMPMW